MTEQLNLLKAQFNQTIDMEELRQYQFDKMNFSPEDEQGDHQNQLEALAANEQE